MIPLLSAHGLFLLDIELGFEAGIRTQVLVPWANWQPSLEDNVVVRSGIAVLRFERLSCFQKSYLCALLNTILEAEQGGKRWVILGILGCMCV